MSSGLFFDNKKYLSAKDASALTGYSRDYVGQLARGGKVESKKIGRIWYVGEESLLKYKNLSIDLTTSPTPEISISSSPLPEEVTKTETKTPAPKITPKVAPQREPYSSKEPLAYTLENYPIFQKEVSSITHKKTPKKFSIFRKQPVSMILSLVGVVAITSFFFSNSPNLLKNIAAISSDLRAEIASLFTTPDVTTDTLATNVTTEDVRSFWGNYLSIGTSTSVVSVSTTSANSVLSAWEDYLGKQNKNTNPITLPKTSNIATKGSTVASPVIVSSNVSQAALVSALRTLVINGLPEDILLQLRGPQGQKGDPGETILSSTPAPIPIIPGSLGVVPPSPVYSPNPFSGVVLTTGGSDIGAKSVLTNTLNVSADSTLQNLSVLGNSNFTGNVSISGTLNPSLTVGSVYFQNASGIAQNNAKFFWDDDNERLGLGTNTPTQTLDVLGTVTSSGSTTLGTGTGTTNTFGSGESSINVIGSTTTPGTLTLHGATTLDNSFSQTGANTFSTGTGAISLNGATTVTGANTLTVGTGLTTLGGNLVVAGTTGITSSGVGAGITFTGTGNHDIVATSGTLRIGSNTVIGNIEALDDTVDIGTVGTRFDKIYANEVNATTLVGTISAGNVTGEAVTINFDNATADTEDAFLVFERGSVIPNAVIGWDSTDDEFDFNTGLRITGTIKADPYLILDSSTASDTDFWLSVQEDGEGDDDDLFQIGDGTTPGTNPFFTINTSGNVGIGTTSPTLGKLHVATSTNALSALAQFSNTDSGTAARGVVRIGNDASPLNGQFTSYSSGYTTSGSHIANSFKVEGGLSGGLSLSASDSTSGAIRFFTDGNAVERAIIDNSGNLGIGTTAPRGPLEVYTGTVYLGKEDLTHGIINTDESTYINIDSNNDDTTEIFQIGKDRTTNSGGTALLTVQEDGNVGIGTTSLTRNLTVRSSGQSDILISGGTANYTQLIFGDTDAEFRGSVSYTHASDRMEFYTAGTVKSVIDSSGNVGIGTTTPTQKLVIESAGNPTSATNTSAVRFNNTVSGRFAIIGIDDSQNLSIWNSQNNGTGVIRFMSSTGTGTELMRIGATGNVGIGTTVPATALDVIGAGSFSTYIAVGTTPANAGAIRIPFNTYISTGRAAGDGAAYEILRNTTGDVLELGIGGFSKLFVNSLSRDMDFQLSSDTNASHYLSDAGMFGGVGGHYYGGGANVGGYFVVSKPAITQAASTNFASMIVGSGSPVTIPAGTTSVVSSLSIAEPNITATGTVSDAYSLYIANAPTEGTRNGAIWVQSGVSRFDGDVGIGTASPATSLDINSSAASYEAGIALHSRASSAENGNWLLVARNNPYFAIENTTAGTKPFVINGSNVGIGTTNPIALLEVKGSQTVGRGVLITESSTSKSNGVYTLEIDSSAHTSNVSAAGALKVGVNSGTALVVTGAGNVGIGTATPGAKLDVNGSIVIASAQNLSWGGAYGAGVPTISATLGGGSPYIAFYPDGSTSGERVRINSSGNVGIGTTTVSEKLHISATDASLRLTTTDNSGNEIQFDRTDTDWRIANETDLRIYPALSGGSSVFQIESSGQVGIGTTNASQRLHLYGTGDERLLVESTTGTAGVYLIPNGNGVGWTMNVTDSATPDLVFQDPVSGGTERIRFMYNSSNIGIGTTNPSFGSTQGTVVGINNTGAGSTLAFLRESDVIADTGVLGNLQFYAGATSKVLAAAIQSQVVGTSEDAASLRFFTKASGGSLTERLTILDNGNVGIGTSAPLSGNKLDIFGRAVVIGDTEVSAGTRGDATTKWGQIVAPHYTNAEEATHLIAAYNTSTNNFIYIGGGLTGSYNAATAIRFATGATNTTTNGTERMRIDSAGSVGIGTTAPEQRLHVGGTGDNILKIGNQEASSDALLGFQTGVGTTAFRGGIGYIDGGTNLSFFAGSNISLTGSTPRMVIDGNTGNVGIGTTAPSALLHVFTAVGASPANNSQPAMRLESSTTAAVGVGPSLMFRGQTGNSTAQYAFSAIQGAKESATAENYDGYLAFFNQSGSGAALTERMRITSAGNVGIGTNNPSTTLEISGGDITISDSAPVITFNDNSGNLNDWQIDVDSTTGSSMTFRDVTGGVNVLTLKNGGNIGIGTTNPQAITELYSASARVDTLYRRITSTTGAELGGVTFYGQDSLSTTQHYAQILGMISSGTSGSEIGRIDFETAVSGSVDKRMSLVGASLGIGTTAPGAKLHVLNTAVSNRIIDTHVKYILEDTESRFQLISANTGTNASAIILSNVQGAGDQRSWVLAHGGTDGSNKFHIGYRVSAAGEDIVDVSGKLFTIQTDGNVGIGTTTPDAKLAIIVPANNYWLRLNDDSGNEKAYIYNYAGAAGLNLRNASQTNTARIMATGDSYLNGGNVGIGTTAPSGLLHVTSSTTALPLSIIENTNADATGSKLRLLKTSASPAAADVLGNISFMGGDNQGTPDPKEYINIQGISEYIVNGDESGGLKINLEMDNATAQFAYFDAYNGSVGQGTITLGNSGNDIDFIVANSGNANSLYVQGSSGNVGIGTSNPGNELDLVKSESGGTVWARIFNSSDTASSAAGLNIVSGGSSAHDPYTVYTVTGVTNWATGIDNSDSDSFKIAAGATLGSGDIMTLTTAGSVGIGTTAPGANKLSIVGSSATSLVGLRLRNTDVTAGAEVILAMTVFNDTGGFNIRQATNSGGPSWNTGSYDAFLQTVQASSKIHFAAGNATTPQVTLNSSGNLGIGITAPAARLSVYGNDGTDTTTFEIFTKQSGTGSFQKIADIVPTGSSSNDGLFRLYDAGTQTVNIAADNPRGGSTYFNGGGNVGIGTNNPTSRLTVASGDILLSSDYTLMFGDSGTRLVGSSATDFLRFDTNGSEAMRIISSGNVGIGTTNPDSKLHVVGSSAVNKPIFSVTGDMQATTGAAYGVKISSNIFSTSGTGTLSSAEGLTIALSTNATAFTTSELYNLRIQNVSLGAGSAVTNQYGLLIDDLTSGGSNNWAIYTGGTAKSYFGGNVGIGTTAPNYPLHIEKDNTAGYIAGLRNTSATDPYGLYIDFSAASPDNNTNSFLAFEDSTTTRFIVYSDGDVQNHDNSYGGISDERLKENISDAPGYLAQLNQISIKQFSFIEDHKAEADDIGVLAQQIETIFPNLVTTNTVTGYKAVTYSKFTPMLIKAVQELNLTLTGIGDRVTALENQINNGGVIGNLGQYATAFFEQGIKSVADGVVYMRALVVDSLKVGSASKPTGITLYNPLGEAYCVSINVAGMPESNPGECPNDMTDPQGLTSPESNPAPEPEPEEENTPDTTPPVIILNGDDIINLTIGDAYSELGATATDDVDESVAVVVTGNIDSQVAGTYEIHYNATDTAGNNAVEVTRTVIVEEGVEGSPVEE